MAAPVSLKNSDSLDLDTLYDASGTAAAKRGISPVTAAGITPPLEGQVVGTHAQGDTFNAADPVAVIGGVDTGGTAESDAALPSCFEAGENALGPDLGLILGDGSQDMAHEAAGRGGEVEPVLDRDEVDLPGGELGE